MNLLDLIYLKADLKIVEWKVACEFSFFSYIFEIIYLKKQFLTASDSGRL